MNQAALEVIVSDVRACTQCEQKLPLGANPVLQAHTDARILIAGQAPGIRVHKSGKPFTDQSGDRLRTWMGVSEAEFYDPTKVSILPMGFCYPGRGKTGDLPPRQECAPQWHQSLFDKMPNVELVILIGMYAQKYYLQKDAKRTLTETVSVFKEYAPRFFPLPHPSPRNRFWLTKNPWFEVEVIPELQNRIQKLI